MPTTRQNLFAKFPKRLQQLVLDRSYPLKKAYRWKFFTEGISPAGPYLWIYSMGKTGTTSLHHSLRTLELEAPVYQFHFMSPENLAAFESLEQRSFGRTQAIFEHAILGRHFLGMTENGLDLSRVKIITAMRDPVARHRFFGNLSPDHGVVGP